MASSPEVKRGGALLAAAGLMLSVVACSAGDPSRPSTAAVPSDVPAVTTATPTSRPTDTTPSSTPTGPTDSSGPTPTSVTTRSTTTITATGAPGDSSAPDLLTDVGLPGVNDPGCRSADPPVVLLHGTFSTPAANFARLAPALQQQGRCVWAVLYGAAFSYGGIGGIDSSAATVSAFVAAVRAASGGGAVDVVAFSQGALVLRAALQRGIPAGGVRLAVFLAPNYHGTTIPLAAKVPAALCPACAQQATGSALLARLADGGELTAGVRYASLLLADDAWVRPLSDQAPRGPTDLVRTQILQDHCPTVSIDHSVLPLAGPAVSWTVDALRSVGRPSDDFSCG